MLGWKHRGCSHGKTELLTSQQSHRWSHVIHSLCLKFQQRNVTAGQRIVCVFWTHKGFKNVNTVLYVFFQLYSLVWSNIFLWWRARKKTCSLLWGSLCDAAGTGRAAGMSCSSPRERAGRTCPVLLKMQCFSAASPLYATGESCLGKEKSCSWSHPNLGLVLRSHWLFSTAKLSSALHSLNCCLCSAHPLPELRKSVHYCYWSCYCFPLQGDFVM